jgi:outer membrane receptor for ferrienterochelin and colicin
MSGQGLKMVRGAVMFGLLGTVAMPVWAGEKQDVVSEKERTVRIQELQRERARVEGELRQFRSQPEGAARSTAPRSELSDQPTRSMKESLESVPGVSARQGSNGRDVSLSIRGSK